MNNLKRFAASGGVVAMAYYALIVFVVLITPTAIISNPSGNQGSAYAAQQQKPAKEEVREATVFAYCMCAKCCGDSNPGGKTANGRDGKKYCDGAAADPKAIPLGTRIYIPGVGDKVVDDTGTNLKEAYKKGELRVCFRVRTHEEVDKFPKQKLKIVILGD